MNRDLNERLFNYACNVLKMLGKLGTGRETDVLKYQLSRSATSVGANYEEAQAAITRAEFRMKILISLKEARESHYRLRLIEAMFPDNDDAKYLKNECVEIKLILGKIASSTKTN